MMYQSKDLEHTAILNVMAAMCAAARTAPKTKGQDYIHTLALTGEDKQRVADKMKELGKEYFGEGGGWYARDAKNVEAAQGLVLIGIEQVRRGLPHCGVCGFSHCTACEQAGGSCGFTGIDLGIAIGSAVSVAADLRADNRIMFSVGKAAMELGLGKEGILWQGIPVSLTGKSIFFDRK